MTSLERKARDSCGRSRCDGCLFVKVGAEQICTVCRESYVKGYKNGYRTAKYK